MRHWKSSLLALTLLTGLTAAPASAQQFGVGGFGGNAFAGNGFVGQGFVGNGFGVNNFGGYNNYGYNNYYNRGSYNVPQTYNNMGGLMNSIRTSTGNGNSWRYGSGPAPGGRRR